jgi:hypothetical protein
VESQRGGEVRNMNKMQIVYLVVGVLVMLSMIISMLPQS